MSYICPQCASPLRPHEVWEGCPVCGYSRATTTAPRPFRVDPLAAAGLFVIVCGVVVFWATVVWLALELLK